MLDRTAFLASRFPRDFHKPVFACAAATRPDAVARSLSVLRALGGVWPILQRQPEMAAIALTAETAGVGADGWADAALGQLALAAELVSGVRTADAAALASFADAFEHRLSAQLGLRETRGLLPLAQRMLLVSLLSAIRLAHDSQKRPGWFDRAVRWATSAFEGASSTLDARSSTTATAFDPFRPSEAGRELRTTARQLDDARTTLAALRALFEAPSPEARRSTATSVSGPDRTSPVASMLAELQAVEPAAPMLSLLATLYGGLTGDHLDVLTPLIWARCLVGVSAQLYAVAMCVWNVSWTI